MSTAGFYNRFAFLYPLVGFFLKKQKRLLTACVNNFPQGTLLEVGVGNGDILKYYRHKAITGIDTSIVMLRKAKQRHPEISFFEMDGRDMAFENNTFDLVVMSHIIAVVPDANALINEAYRVLKPGGTLLILNHFTPGNFLGMLDRAVKPIGRLLKLKTEFYVCGLSLGNFAMKEEISCGMFLYYKILILQKI